MVGCGDGAPAEPAPEVLATLAPRLDSIALSSDEVYVGVRRDPGPGLEVQAIAKSGGAAHPVHEAEIDRVTRVLGADESSVYWLEWDGVTGTLRAARLADGDVRTLATADGLTNAVLDGEFVYFGAEEGDHVALARVATAGGAAEPIGDVAAGLVGVLADEAHLFGISASTESLWRLAKTGGAAEELASGVDVYTASSDVRTAAFASDDDALYYYARVGDGITRVAKGGGEPQVLALFGSGCADSLAVDETDVFWTCSGAPVYRGDVRGSGGESTIPDSRTIGELAVDGTRVYWLTLDAVMAVQK